MSDAKRILTVSYGAFSCTLDGFADPVATLRQVTEHFRDLAAQDPSFGAPPVAAQAAAKGGSPRIRPQVERAPSDPMTAPAPIPKAAEVSVSRLLSATDTALDDPDTRRRRAAIAQLKAAVLAQMAQHRGPVDQAVQRRSAFQQDLAQSAPAAPLSAQQARKRGQERP